VDNSKLNPQPSAPPPSTPPMDNNKQNSARIVSQKTTPLAGNDAIQEDSSDEENGKKR